MDYYHYYCDRYQAKLNVVGYEIVAVTVPPEVPFQRLKIRNKVKKTEEYTINAIDEAVDRFIEGIERRKIRERAEKMLFTTMSATSAKNTIENHFKNKLDGMRTMTLVDELDIWSSAEITGANKKSVSIEKVIFNPPATIVLWKDGSKTVVKCGDDEIFDMEKGLAMAICKRMFGNKGNYFNVFNKWCVEPETMPTRKRPEESNLTPLQRLFQNATVARMMENLAELLSPRNAEGTSENQSGENGKAGSENDPG